MKILSSFTHPQVFPDLYECVCSEHKGWYFWRKFLIRLFWGTIDFHSKKRKYCGSQWCPKTARCPTFFRISSFMFSRTNTFIQVWKYLRMSKWQNFHFGVNNKRKITMSQGIMPIQSVFFVTKITSIFNTVTPPWVLLNSNLRSLRHFSTLQPITDDSVELMNALTNQRSLW